MSTDYDDLLADIFGTSKKETEEEVNSVTGKVLESCRLLAGSSQEDRFTGLKMLKEALSQGADLNERDFNSFRGVDLLSRGLDSPESAAAIEWMAEADFAEQMMVAPTASEMPPMMAACYYGNPSIVDKFLELGMEGDVIANAPKHRILNGTPFHAAVVGYRQVRQNDYVSVVNSLLSYCPDGINIPDRLKQRPIDIAMKNAAASGDKVMIATLMNHGVEFDSKSFIGADKLMDEILKKEATDGLKSLVTANEAKRVINEIEAMTRNVGLQP